MADTISDEVSLAANRDRIPLSPEAYQAALYALAQKILASGGEDGGATENFFLLSDPEETKNKTALEAAKAFVDKNPPDSPFRDRRIREGTANTEARRQAERMDEQAIVDELLNRPGALEDVKKQREGLATIPPPLWHIEPR